MNIHLKVPQILQNPELPNGCEITSCCEILRFLGYDADKCELADHYLPKSDTWYGTDPNIRYMGNPRRDDGSPETGYYCFAGPVVAAANRYMQEHVPVPGESGKHVPAPGEPGKHAPVPGETREHAPVPGDPRETSASAYTAVDLTGAGEEELVRQLSLGRPFIFWASLHFDDIQYDSCEPYLLKDQTMHHVFHQLHCMVCDGVDERYFYIADPLDYNTKVERSLFMKIYRQLGSRAVVFVPARKSCIRDYGLVPGSLPPGERNNICDVPGVKVGHWTLHNEKHHTGVTVILPRENIYTHKCTAAAWVLNGYGKSAGLAQIQELGQMESPIALTNTLNVGLVSDALVQYTVDQLAEEGKTLRSFNPVVGECNDAGLNTICERVAGYPEVMSAIRSAGADFLQGCAGAGAGMTCHGLKGGIGSASRILEADGKTWTVGVLALCNHGELRELNILGRKIGKEIQEKLHDAENGGVKAAVPDHDYAGEDCAAVPDQEYPGEDRTAGPDQEYPGEDRTAGPDQEYPGEDRTAVPAQNFPGEDRGSCMMILATDLPLSDRQLLRVIKRTAVGMARCGSYWGHGSGDFAIGFTTAGEIREGETRHVIPAYIWNEDRLDPVFAAAAEAAEEAVLNALAAAEQTTGPDGTVRHALSEFM